MERVDVTGEVCPRPALIVRDRLSALPADEELLVRGDYPPAERNLRRTCTKHGYEVETRADASASDDGFELVIRRSAGEKQAVEGETADGNDG